MTHLLSWQLFQRQKDLFMAMVEEVDPQVINLISLKSKPKKVSNWFDVFRPSIWGKHKKGFGIHYTFRFQIDKDTQEEFIRLPIGIESPLMKAHKENFKKEIVKEYRMSKSFSSQYILYPDAGIIKRTKLLEIPDVPLDDSTSNKVFEFYQELESFNKIVSNKIKEYSEIGYFKERIIFPPF